jgi:hypothetical protein
MKTIEYCWQWNRTLKCPVRPKSEEEARKMHVNREAYTAILKEDGKPYAIAECVTNEANHIWAVKVELLDDYLRCYVAYQFLGECGGKVFLRMAADQEFDGEKDDVSKTSLYHFREDGKVIVEDIDYTNKTKSSFETTADLSGNWEDYPTFGNYDAVTRVERLPNPQ